jgi:hypothetical protein
VEIAQNINTAETRKVDDKTQAEIKSLYRQILETKDL